MGETKLSMDKMMAEDYTCFNCGKVLSNDDFYCDKEGITYCSKCYKLLPNWTKRRFNNVSENKKEMINHPEHYGGDTAYECIKVLKAWNTKEEFIAFCKNNAIKYLCRLGKKDDELQELKKALWYLQEAVKYLEEIKN